MIRMQPQARANNLHKELQEFFERENAMFEIDALQRKDRERALARTMYNIVMGLSNTSSSAY